MLNDHDILDNLADALAECPEPGDEVGPPGTWGPETDLDIWELGPDLDVDPLDYHSLAGEDEPIIDAEDMMLDMIERMTLERETCTARFV